MPPRAGMGGGSSDAEADGDPERGRRSRRRHRRELRGRAPAAAGRGRAARPLHRPQEGALREARRRHAHQARATWQDRPGGCVTWRQAPGRPRRRRVRRRRLAERAEARVLWRAREGPYAARQGGGEEEDASQEGRQGRPRRPLPAESLVDAIRARVCAVSETTHRAGLMLLDIIMTCQDNGRRMPKFTQTFFLQMLLSNRVNPYVATALEGPFSAFPAPQRYRKDSQLYSSAAASMLTNFKGVLQGSSFSRTPLSTRSRPVRSATSAPGSARTTSATSRSTSSRPSTPGACVRLCRRSPKASLRSMAASPTRPSSRRSTPPS